MGIIERTINVGSIGTKAYRENLDMTLSVHKHRGFTEIKPKEVSEKLIIYGYKNINNGNKEIVKELYK